MANLTPTEQDDSAAITRLEITDPILGYDPGNPGAGDGKSNEQAQKIANTLLFLRRRVGVQGNWDMTGVDADTIPASTLNLEMTTATVSAAQYTGTPVNGSSLFKMAASTVIKKESAARSARLRASTGGGNFTGVSALIYSNHDATAADVAASLMGTLTGTCTHFAGMFLDGAGVIGAGAFKIVMRTDDPINGNVSETLVAAGGYAALDQIYSTFNGTTGLFSVTVNAGSPVAGTNVWDVSGTTALRAWVLGYHSANPPSLPDVTYDFDFSDNTSGRTGFQTTSDPAVPSGAADSKRYLVSVAGSYGGRSAAIGDIVEFHTSLAAIQVLPATTWTQPLIEALVNPYITANPAAVQALIDASLASNVAPTVEYDVETEYATLGGASPGEFEMGPLVNGATLWSSASTFTALNTYASGYTPVPGDSFFLHFNEFDPTLAITAVGTHNVAVASDWDYAAYTGVVPADFMRTPRKRYQFVFTYVDGTNDRWTLQNPDVVAWGDSVTAAPLAIGVTAGTRGRPGTTTVVSSTGNGEIGIPLVANVAANGAEPFKVGQSCRIVVDGNTTRIRIIGNSSGVGGITFTSNLPVQSIVVGPVNEPAVDIIGVGHAITVTYQGSDTWHIFAPSAEEQAVGHLHMDNNATATTIAVTGTYYKVDGVTTGALLDHFTHSNNRLTYTGLAPKKIKISVSAALKSGSNNQIVGIQVAKNGSVVTGGKMRGKLLSAGDPTNMSITDATDIVNGDYIELFVTNETGTNAITVEDLQMTIGGVR